MRSSPGKGRINATNSTARTPRRCRAGGSRIFSMRAALIAALKNHLREKPCRPHGSEWTISHQSSISDPIVMFEILRDGARLNLGVNDAEY